MNFTLSSFTPQSTALQNLFSLSLQTPAPAHPIFYSSVSTRIASPHGPVPIAPISSFAHASPTGYARAKLVCERIIETAVASSKTNATILRISQITPSTTVGTRLWNPAEAIPLMIRGSYYRLSAARSAGYAELQLDSAGCALGDCVRDSRTSWDREREDCGRACGPG